MQDGCVRLLQAVLADTRTARAGQDWMKCQLTMNLRTQQPSKVTPPPERTATPLGLSEGQVATTLGSVDSRHPEDVVEVEPKDISRHASDMIVEILSSPAMEQELQRVLRSTLRSNAVQEAAADAVGGVGRLTAAAAAGRLQALLPWRW